MSLDSMVLAKVTITGWKTWNIFRITQIIYFLAIISKFSNATEFIWETFVLTMVESQINKVSN